MHPAAPKPATGYRLAPASGADVLRQGSPPADLRATGLVRVHPPGSPPSLDFSLHPLTSPLAAPPHFTPRCTPSLLPSGPGGPARACAVAGQGSSDAADASTQTTTVRAPGSGTHAESSAAFRAATSAATPQGSPERRPLIVSAPANAARSAAAAARAAPMVAWTRSNTPRNRTIAPSTVPRAMTVPEPESFPSPSPGGMLPQYAACPLTAVDPAGRRHWPAG